MQTSCAMYICANQKLQKLTPDPKSTKISPCTGLAKSKMAKKSGTSTFAGEGEAVKYGMCKAAAEQKSLDVAHIATSRGSWSGDLHVYLLCTFQTTSFVQIPCTHPRCL